MEYKVIEASNLVDLKDKVNQQIKYGYIPQGGILLDGEYSNNYGVKGFYQAMIKITKIKSSIITTK